MPGRSQTTLTDSGLSVFTESDPCVRCVENKRSLRLKNYWRPPMQGWKRIIITFPPYRCRSVKILSYTGIKAKDPQEEATVETRQVASHNISIQLVQIQAWIILSHKKNYALLIAGDEYKMNSNHSPIH